MKKILLVLCICCGLSTSVLSGTCNGGTEFTSADNHTYCFSKNQMTWWAALAWCEYQGRTMPTLTQLCGAVDGKSCPNIKAGMFPPGDWLYAWTATPIDDQSVYRLNGWGTLYDLSRASISHALCY